MSCHCQQLVAMRMLFGVRLKCIFEFVCVYCHSWWLKRYPIDSNFHPIAFPENLKHTLKNNRSNSMRKLLIRIRAHAKSHILVTSISQGRRHKLKLIFCIDVPQRCLKQHAKAEYDCDMPTRWISRSKSGNSKTGNPLLLNNYGSWANSDARNGLLAQF